MEINEEEREYLLEIVDSLVFVDEVTEVDKFKCLNCGVVAIQHSMANCNHIFCSNCIRDLFHKMCPSCGNMKITEVTRNGKFDDQMLKLKVECRNKKFGCNGIIPLHKCHEHELTCRFSTTALLPKASSVKLSLSAEIKGISEDLHQVKLTIKKIQKEIEEENNWIINYMDTLSVKIYAMSFEFEDMQVKLREIIEQIRETEPRATDLNLEAKYADLERRLTLQTDDLSRLRTHIAVKEYADMEELDGQSTIFIWKIHQFQHQLQRLKNRNLSNIISETFSTAQQGLKLRAALELDHASAFLIIGLIFEATTKTYWHARKFALVDQSNSIEKKHLGFWDVPVLRSDSANLVMSPRISDQSFVPITALERENVYVRDDSVLIVVVLKPLSLLYKSVASTNGNLLWRIDNYSSKKQDEINSLTNFQMSNSFYTSPQGYRARSIVMLNGHQLKRGIWLSMYTIFVKGEFDHMLNYPFCFNVNTHLMDQSDSPDKKHIFKKDFWQYVDGNYHIGIHDYILQKDVEDAKYLKDDSILFKVMIDTY